VPSCFGSSSLVCVFAGGARNRVIDAGGNAIMLSLQVSFSPNAVPHAKLESRNT